MCVYYIYIYIYVLIHTDVPLGKKVGGFDQIPYQYNLLRGALPAWEFCRQSQKVLKILVLQYFTCFDGEGS